MEPLWKVGALVDLISFTVESGTDREAGTRSMPPITNNRDHTEQIQTASERFLSILKKKKGLTKFSFGENNKITPNCFPTITETS